MTALGPGLLTRALPQVGSYLGYRPRCRHPRDAAIDPQRTWWVLIMPVDQRGGERQASFDLKVGVFSGTFSIFTRLVTNSEPAGTGPACPIWHRATTSAGSAKTA